MTLPALTTEITTLPTLDHGRGSPHARKATLLAARTYRLPTVPSPRLAQNSGAIVEAAATHGRVRPQFRARTRLPPLESELRAPQQRRVGVGESSEAAAGPLADPSAYSLGGGRRPDGSGSSRSVAPKASSKRNDPLAPIGFRTVGPIAAGAFSTVVRARRARGSGGGADASVEVAVKSFAKTKYQKTGWLKNALKNEIDVLSTLQISWDAHIANLLELHETPQATHAVLEYCAGGSVHRHLRSLRHGQGLAEEVSAMLVQQLALALAHVHSLGIAHRDVKAENVLYTDASRRCIKLCDFGFAIVCGERKLRTVCGSPAYMAPELSTREAYFGAPVDLWALGCFAFEVLHGTAPFRGDSLDTLNLRIKRVDHAPFRKGLSHDAQCLIKQLLVVDPLERCMAAAAASRWEAHAKAADAAAQAQPGC